MKVYTMNVHPPAPFPHSAPRKLEARLIFSSLKYGDISLWGDWQPQRNDIKVVRLNIPHKITQSDLPTVKP